MGPEYWKPGSPTALQKCGERVSNSCTDETDGCCAVIPCGYCLEWNPDTGSTLYSFADFATNNWNATIAGVTWRGYWERNYDTNECEFVVTLNDVEIYRKSCYEGQSCRDSSDAASATISEINGVITWTKYEPRALEYVQDPDTHCTVHFCDDCECSCDCLCVTITETGMPSVSGEICDTAYLCDSPLWEGVVDGYDLSLALGRDEYGRCIITATVDGIEQEPVLFPGCSSGEATITLGDGTTIAVRCKQCDCSETVSLCCGGRNLSGTLYLRAVYPGTSTLVECGDSLVTLTDAGDGNWYGSATFIAEVPGGGGEECVEFDAHFHFYCDGAGPLYQLNWYFEYLGTRYPTSGWCGLVRAGEDCDYPYLGTWDENIACGGFWNGFYTFLVSEVPI